MALNCLEHRLWPRWPRKQNTCRPHREGKVQAISQPISEEEFCHAEKAVFARDLQNCLRIALSADHHIVLKMNTCLRLPCAARRVQPERYIVFCRGRRLQFTRTATDQIFEIEISRRFCRSYDNDGFPKPQLFARNFCDQRQERLADDRYASARIVQQIPVIGRLQQGVHRNRYGSYLDGAEEARRELRRVEQEQQNPLFHPNTELLQTIAHLIDAMEKLAVREADLTAFDSDLLGPPFLDVAINEMSSGVELVRQQDR